MADKFYVGDTGGFDAGFDSGSDIGLAVGNIWNDASVWAAISGGPGGAGVPGVADTAIFDANSPDCLCDVEPNCDIIDLRAGYAGTLDFDTFGANVNRILVADGALDMGSAKVDVNSTGGGQGFRQSGGTVTLTSGTLECNSDFERTAGVLNHGGGTLFMNRVAAADRDLNVNGASLNNVTITYGAYAVDWDSDVTILGDLIFNNGRALEGTADITLKGDFETNTTSEVYTTACRLIMDGTGDQEIRSAGGTRRVPASLKIDKPSGTLTFTGALDFYSNSNRIEYVQGTLDWSGCTLLELSGHDAYLRATADFTIGAATLRFDTGGFKTYIENGTVILTGNFLLASCGTAGVSTGGGVLHLQGADILVNDGVTNYPANLEFRVNGTGDQVIRRTSGSAGLTKLVIDKPSGTLTIQDTIAICGDAAATPQLEYIQGTVVCTGTIYLGRDNYNSMRYKTGAMELNNIIFNPISSYNATIDGPMIVKGNMTVTRVQNISQVNSGRIDLEGNLVSTDAGVGGNCPVNMVGSGAQQIDITGAEFGNGDLTVNKTGGKVTLASDFDPPSWSGDFTVQAGTLDLAGFDLVIGTALVVKDTLELIGTETVTETGGSILGAASTVNFYGAATAIIDNLATTFNNVNLDRDGDGKEIQTTAAATVTFNGQVTTGGDVSTPTLIRSTVAGNVAFWNLAGNQSLANKVDVKDNDADGGNTWFVYGSVDSGNNSNWIFAMQGGEHYPRATRIHPAGEGFCGAMNPSDFLGYTANGMPGQGAAGGLGSPGPTPPVPPGPANGTGSFSDILLIGRRNQGGGPTSASWYTTTGAPPFTLQDTVPVGTLLLDGGRDLNFYYMHQDTDSVSFRTAVFRSANVNGPWTRVQLAPLAIWAAGTSGQQRSFMIGTDNTLYALGFRGNTVPPVGIIGWFVFRSTDQGLTWTQATGQIVGAGGNVNWIWMSYAGTLFAYRAITGSMFRSTDKGDSWSVVSNGVNSGFVTLLGQQQAGATIYALTDNGAAPDPSVEVMTSADDGATWNNLVPTTLAGLDAPNFFLVTQAGSLLATDANGIYRSVDGGANWTQVQVGMPGNLNSNTIRQMNDANKTLICIYGSTNGLAGNFGYYVSTDDGATWSNVAPVGVNPGTNYVKSLVVQKQFHR